MNEPNPKHLLAEQVMSIARDEWSNEDSITYKNRRSIPGNLRDAFVIFADMGGVCTLDSGGSVRAFMHDEGDEIEVTDMILRMALSMLKASRPELWELVHQTETTRTGLDTTG